MYCQQIHASGSSSNTYNSSLFEQSSEAQNYHVLSGSWADVFFSGSWADVCPIISGSWADVFAHHSCHCGQVLLFLSLLAL